MKCDLSQVEAFRHYPTGWACRANDPDGCFYVPVLNGPMLTVVSSVGEGWDHLSVSARHRCPTWEEMCYIKRLFFEPSECVMQLHPPEADYINNHPYVLHLWRPQTKAEIDGYLAAGWPTIAGPAGVIPRPPGHMVGIAGVKLPVQQ